MPTGPTKYTVRLTEDAAKMLRKADGNARKKISEIIDSLTDNPGEKGKPLVDDLHGLRSVRAASRFRVIYRVGHPSPWDATVLVIGLRKRGDKSDPYAIAARMRARGDI